MREFETGDLLIDRLGFVQVCIDVMKNVDACGLVYRTRPSGWWRDIMSVIVWNDKHGVQVYPIIDHGIQLLSSACDD